MATPGYPHMGQGPMMGGMPPIPPTRGPRRGTSRAVPVVVSAGLAVGVFCGLLFGLGTGDKADAKPSTGNNLKHDADGVDPNAAPAGLGASTVAPTTGPAKPAAGSGGGIGSAVVAMAGTGSGSAGSAAGSAAAKTMKITIDIDPDTVAGSATIKIDGKAITGKTAEVPADTKQIHVQINADGYHSYDANIDVSGTSGDEHDVKVKLLKRATGAAPSSPGFGGASTGGNHVPTAPPKPPKKPTNNGIIDI